MTSDAHDQHRVEFDFELEFTNGGALQGQGFRLDIDGDDISDDELGAYIVADLRLLMVGDVRILNKRILRERHKRAKAAATQGQGDGGRTRVDLSHDVEDGMITFPGLPGPRIGEVLTHVESRSRYAGDTEFQIGEIAMVANTGTYVDSPFHRYADREDVAALSLDRIADVDTVVVNVAGTERRAVDRRLLLPFDVADKAVLVHTGWDRRWGTDAYVEEPPFLTADGAEHLAISGALLVGVDWLNIDDTGDPTRPAHSTLLGAGIPSARTSPTSGRCRQWGRDSPPFRSRSAAWRPSPCARSRPCPGRHSRDRAGSPVNHWQSAPDTLLAGGDAS
jgi:arylformamidase